MTDLLEGTVANPRYTAADIQVLEGLEAVRLRPGMYIGSTDERGLHHLVYEIVDNSVDEAMAGYCDKVTVTMLADGSMKIEDNGRGVPVETHTVTGVSSVETVFTKLHAGGKFGSGSYQVSGGLHGVGASVVNFLSEWLWVEVKRDGFTLPPGFPARQARRALGAGRQDHHPRHHRRLPPGQPDLLHLRLRV